MKQFKNKVHILKWEQRMLQLTTTYYWYVVAKYDGNIVANSPTWSFKTGDNSGN